MAPGKGSDPVVERSGAGVVYLAANDMNVHDAQRAHVWEFCRALLAQAPIQRVTLVTPTETPSAGLGDRFEHVSVHAPHSPLRLLFREWRILQYLWRRWRRDPTNVLYMRNGRLSFGGSLFATLSGTPLVLEINGVASEEYRLTTRAPAIVAFFVGKVFDHLFRFNCLRSHKIITVTTGLGEYVIERFGISRESVCVVPNGVNTSTFFPMDIRASKAKVKLDHRVDYIGFVGSLRPWEGVAWLIKAFARVGSTLPHYHLVIVGDGPDRDPLARLAKDLDVADRVVFTGRVPHGEVPSYVNSCKFLVAPAVHARKSVFEISPLKTYEYLACGKPVVASRIPGLEFVGHERLGFVFTPGDSLDLADALRRAANLTAGELDALAVRARQVATERHSWNHLVGRIVHFALGDERIRSVHDSSTSDTTES